MMLVVINRDRVLMDPQHPIWEHYRSFKWWLLPHGAAGVLVLFLAPLQFSETLRRKFLGWHRRIGRTYVYAVAVLAPLGIVIEAIKYTHGIAPLRLLVASTGFGGILGITTAIGFWRAKHRNIPAHRIWMTRSYAVALVFLEVRCVDRFAWLGRLVEWPSTLLERHGIADLWMFVAFAFVAAEIALWFEKRTRTRLRVA
jgi:uncharacterized membrane protein